MMEICESCIMQSKKLKLHKFILHAIFRSTSSPPSRWSRWILGPDFNPAEADTHSIHIWSLSRACLPLDLNPGPWDQPADQKTVTLNIRPRWQQCIIYLKHHHQAGTYYTV